MNGARTTFMRRGYLLTALAAAVLLAASSGTALAQNFASSTAVEIDSVSLASPTVNEGGEATAIVKFTVTAGDNEEQEAINATVRFAFDASNAVVGPTDARATQATAANFTGITSDLAQSQEIVPVARLRPGASRTYEARRTFRVNHDLDAENGKFKLDAQIENGTTDIDTAPSAAVYIITDDETQSYTLSLPQANRGAIVEGGRSAMVTLTADPKRTAAAAVPDFTLVREPASRIYTLTRTLDTVKASLSTGTEGSRVTHQAATIEAAADGNRTNDTVTLKLYTGTVGASQVITELPITVTDIHTLPAADAITAEAKDKDTGGDKVTEIVEGGDPVYLTITVDRGSAATRDATTTEALTIDIGAAAAQAGDYEVEPARVTLEEQTAGGKQSTDVSIKLTALSDQDVGPEDLVLNLTVSGEAVNGSGTSTGTFTIAIVDDTAKQVAPKSEDELDAAVAAAIDAGGGDEGLNPEESFEVMTSDLFTVTPGCTASYGASVSGGAVSASASGDSVVVTAVEAGDATVTVTATAKCDSSSARPSQTVSNIAEVAFDVKVVNRALVLTLEMPSGVMDGNIVEGKSYDITVSANRAVDSDTEVTFARDRSQSDADENDYSIDPVTIMAGSDSATAELMVTEDMEPDAGHAMGEALVIYGMAGDMQTNDLMFTIWDEAVPALPLIAQLVLALIMALGGARLYRRRQG